MVNVYSLIRQLRRFAADPGEVADGVEAFPKTRLDDDGAAEPPIV